LFIAAKIPHIAHAPVVADCVLFRASSVPYLFISYKSVACVIFIKLIDGCFFVVLQTAVQFGHDHVQAFYLSVT